MRCIPIWQWILMVALCLSVAQCSQQPGTPGLPLDPESVLTVAESVDPEIVRTVAHQYINLQARVMKLKVDVTIDAWNQLSPEQKRSVMKGLVKGFHLATDQLQQAAGPALQELMTTDALPSS
ncbi:MAG: hypothetical protein NPIRA01_40860 [Nitrospirales bacterium]|nr:MAG: hypothetical protein NPIRA01_40860 [Nitrospirales bacterium]